MVLYEYSIYFNVHLSRWQFQTFRKTSQMKTYKTTTTDWRVQVCLNFKVNTCPDLKICVGFYIDIWWFLTIQLSCNVWYVLIEQWSSSTFIGSSVCYFRLIFRCTSFFNLNVWMYKFVVWFSLTCFELQFLFKVYNVKWLYTQTWPKTNNAV